MIGHQTQAEIAEMTGLSRQRITQILAAARERLEEAETGDKGVLTRQATSIANTLTPAEAEALEAGFADVDRRTADHRGRRPCNTSAIKLQ